MLLPSTAKPLFIEDLDERSLPSNVSKLVYRIGVVLSCALSCGFGPTVSISIRSSKVSENPAYWECQLIGRPSGSLGNTCYMNSSLQVLRQIPELRDTLSG
jgi:ubiquitin C-terminal hydrolase